MSSLSLQDFSIHYLVDPTPGDFFSEGDYLHPVNDETIYRLTQYSYENVQDDLNRLFPSVPPKNWAEKYFDWWMDQKKTEVMEVDPYFYDAVDRQQWDGDWTIGSSGKKMPPPPVFPDGRFKSTDLRQADLREGEMKFLFQADRAERVKIPTGGGWLALDYEKGAEIQAHFALESGEPVINQGDFLMSFKGVSVSLRPEQLADLAREQYGIPVSPKILSTLDAWVTATKKYYQIPVSGLVVFGGRSYLQFELSSHPWIGGLYPYPVFVELSSVSNVGWEPRDINSDLLLKTAEEMLTTAGGGIDDGVIAGLIPSSYSGVLWLRSLSGNYPEVEIEDGVFRLDFDSQGVITAEGSFPLHFLHRAFGTEEQTASANIDFRVRNDETGKFSGWMECESDELPLLLGRRFESGRVNLFFSDLLFHDNPDDFSGWIAQMIHQFEFELVDDGAKSVLVEGGGIYARRDSQVDILEKGNVLSFPGLTVGKNAVTVSWNGTDGTDSKNFELSGFSFEIMEGLKFDGMKLRGSYRQSAEETVMDVTGRFHFSVDGPFMADKSVVYEGEVIWNRQEQTVTLTRLDIPIIDMVLNLKQGDENYPFLFSGRLTGLMTLDLRQGRVTGPFVLKGDLFYEGDARESGISLLPKWLRMNGPFLAHVPFYGEIYRPGEAKELKEAGEAIQESRSANLVQSIEEVSFQVNSLTLDKKSGAVTADLLIELASISLMTADADVSEAALQFSDASAISIEPEHSGSFFTPLVIDSTILTLDDWDIYLERYGLDRDKAEMLLDIIRNSAEANFSLTGFQLNRTDSPLLKTATGALPQIDVRIVDGRVERFHFYFSKPIGIPPVIRGVYFDRRAGKFRLDLINHRDGNRPADFYRISRDDPGMTRQFFRLLSLPEELVDRLLFADAANPGFVTDDASAWLELLLLTLVALEENTFQQLEAQARDGYPVVMDEAKITIGSLRLKQGTTLSLYGTRFETGCDHDAVGDGQGNHGDNLLTGTVDLGEGTLRLRMDNVDKLHIFVPGGEGEPPLVDLMLRDGEIGEIEMKRDGTATVLRIGGMNFSRSRLTGKPFEENLDLRLVSNFQMHEMEVRQESGEKEQTTITTNFSADLKEGYLHFRKGKREADFEMGPSPLWVKSTIRFDEVVRPVSPVREFLGPNGGFHRSIADTVLTASEFDITSDQLVFSEVRLSPGIVFDHSVTRDAHIILRSDEGGEEDMLSLTGNFNWQMNRPFPVPLARIELMPRLTPALQFDSVGLSGLGELLFDRDTIKTKGDLRVNYAGSLAVEQVPIADKPSFVTRLNGRFEGSHQYHQGDFFLDESSDDFPLHVDEMTAGNMVMYFHDINGIVYVESPSPKGVAAHSFVDGTGIFSAAEVHLQGEARADFTGMFLQINDHGPARNFVRMEGNMKVHDKIFEFDDLTLEADLYDELSKARMKGIRIKSRPLASGFIPISGLPQ